MMGQHWRQSKLELRESLLLMPEQNLAVAFIDPAAPQRESRVITPTQLIVLGLPALLSLLLGYLMFSGLSETSAYAFGTIALIACVLVPFYWEAVAAALSVAGLFWKPEAPNHASTELQIAIIVLLHDENAEPVMERAARLLETLSSQDRHGFSLHVLSDSRNQTSLMREQSVFHALQRRHRTLSMAYRHRQENVDYKSGNIRDWIRQSGHLHDAMLVLDADSAMQPGSILQMAEMLAADPACALVQSVPRVMRGETLWQNMQSFASHMIGNNLGKGLALFSRHAANYYGHNAIVRIKSFAVSAGLPHLAGDAPFGGVIMSHDFVEAALLRRAGWKVRLMPEVSASFEETPEDIVGFLSRDSRWCHGNMQHLSLLMTPGLDPVSRFHLLQGAMTYMNAPLWLLAMLLWMQVPGLTSNFQIAAASLIVLMTVLMPRIVGLCSFPDVGPDAMSLRNVVPFALKEFFLSSLLAPSLMVQRTKMVLAIALGKSAQWTMHRACKLSHVDRLKFHATEMVLGAGLCGVVTFGFASWWVLPVAFSLLLSPALSAIVSSRTPKVSRKTGYEHVWK
jgi:membrane glycosyltransferase